MAPERKGGKQVDGYVCRSRREDGGKTREDDEDDGRRTRGVGIGEGTHTRDKGKGWARKGEERRGEGKRDGVERNVDLEDRSLDFRITPVSSSLLLSPSPILVVSFLFSHPVFKLRQYYTGS